MNERKKVDAEAKAEISFGQALWYAWGRLDSGAYMPEIKAKLDAFKFAKRVKVDSLAFELQESHFLESIQDAWEKFVAGELAPFQVKRCLFCKERVPEESKGEQCPERAIGWPHSIIQ